MSAREDDPTAATSPYGSSKLMTEIMLCDAEAVHGLRYMILRYFNVAGADPLGRTGQSTRSATHLIKVAVETALGLRPILSVFGSDYRMPDGTRIRDYIHVSDLIAVHCDALAYLRAGGASTTLNCGYGPGFSVLEVIDASPASISRSSSPAAGRAIRHRSSPPATASALRSNGSRVLTIWKPSSATRWHGSASFRNAPVDRKPAEFAFDHSTVTDMARLRG